MIGGSVRCVRHEVLPGSTCAAAPSLRLSRRCATLGSQSRAKELTFGGTGIRRRQLGCPGWDRRTGRAGARGGRRHRWPHGRQRPRRRRGRLRRARGARSSRRSVAHRGPGRVPVDLGGSWLHHPSGNPLRRFAADAGIACRPGDPLPTPGRVRPRHRDVARHPTTSRHADGGRRRLQRGAGRSARTPWPAGLRRRWHRRVPGEDRARRRVAATGPAEPPGECRGGRRRRSRGSVTDVALDAGGVRRRLLRRSPSGRLHLGRRRDGLRARRTAGLAGGGSRHLGRERLRLVGRGTGRDRHPRRRHGAARGSPERPAEVRATASGSHGPTRSAGSASGATRRSC